MTKRERERGMPLASSSVATKLCANHTMQTVVGTRYLTTNVIIAWAIIIILIFAERIKTRYFKSFIIYDVP